MSRSRGIFSLIVTLSLVIIFFSVRDDLPKKSEANKDLRTTKMSKIREPADMEKSLLEPKYKSNEFQAGMNVLIYGHPDMSKARSMFLRLRKLGINSVALTFPFYQLDWKASEVSTDPMITPTMNELEQLIEEAHDIGLSVMLRPILDEESLMASNRWRGQIRPTDPNAWFDSYRSLLLTYADLAQLKKIKVLNIGTEFNSLQQDYNNQWKKLIKDVRHIYKGELAYSFNWDTVEEIATNEFVPFLDHVGLDAYFPLELPDGANVEELKSEWLRQIGEWKNLLNHDSIIITEAGIVPIAGAYRNPYDWKITDGSVDWQAQANYYDATYQVWRPMVQGIYWWTVTLEETPEEISYSPLGSQTESVIKSYFLKSE